MSDGQKRGPVYYEALLREFGEAYREYHDYMCSETGKRYDAAYEELMQELLK